VPFDEVVDFVVDQITDTITTTTSTCITNCNQPFTLDNFNETDMAYDLEEQEQLRPSKPGGTSTAI
jgi:hypothetical protein